jgi:hypothetical protein
MRPLCPQALSRLQPQHLQVGPMWPRSWAQGVVRDLASLFLPPVNGGCWTGVSR